MRKKLNYDFLDCAKKMPPLAHKHTGQKFCIEDSDVVQWLVSQPDVMQKIFDMANNKKVITYDPVSKKWKGVDYDGD